MATASFSEGLPSTETQKTDQSNANRTREEIMQFLENVKPTAGIFPEFIESIPKPYLNKRCDTFQAGYIAKCLPSWRKITNDSEIISAVMGMPIPFDSYPTQHYLPDSKRTQEEILLIDAEIQKLLSKQAIEPPGTLLTKSFQTFLSARKRMENFAG